jgi:hypothetical protein
MFYVTLIIGSILHLTLAFQNQTETIIDLYNKINTYGSIIKATSFDQHTQTKLKYINTVRMISYKGLSIRRKTIKKFFFSSSISSK